MVNSMVLLKTQPRFVWIAITYKEPLIHSQGSNTYKCADLVEWWQHIRRIVCILIVRMYYCVVLGYHTSNPVGETCMKVKNRLTLQKWTNQGNTINICPENNNQQVSGKTRHGQGVDMDVISDADMNSDLVAMNQLLHMCSALHFAALV